VSESILETGGDRDEVSLSGVVTLSVVRDD